MKTITRLVPLAVALALLTSCTAAPSEDYSLQYQELDSRIFQVRGEAVAACLAEKGFPDAIVGEDGSVGYSPQEAQRDLYQAAMDSCLSSVCPECGHRPSDAKLKRLYYLQIEARECLAAEGYPTSAPPTVQTFYDTYGTDAQWAPWGEIGLRLAKENLLATILERCPDPVEFVTF